MTPKPVTPELVAAAIFAACQICEVEPTTVYDRKNGNRSARVLAAAALFAAGVRPRSEIIARLSIDEHDLKPTRLVKYGASPEVIQAVALALTGEKELPKVVTKAERARAKVLDVLKAEVNAEGMAQVPSRTLRTRTNLGTVDVSNALSVLYASGLVILAEKGTRASPAVYRVVREGENPKDVAEAEARRKNALRSAVPGCAEDGWTEEREEALKKLRAEGVSYGRLAMLFGVTRNAVMGKCHRQDLAMSSGAKAATYRIKARTPKAPPKAKHTWRTPGEPKAPNVEPLRSRAWDPLVGSEPKLLLERTGCKWPVGEAGGADQLFCANRCVGPYCKTHKALSERPPTKGEREAVRTARRQSDYERRAA